MNERIAELINRLNTSDCKHDSNHTFVVDKVSKYRIEAVCKYMGCLNKIDVTKFRETISSLKCPICGEQINNINILKGLFYCSSCGLYIPSNFEFEDVKFTYVENSIFKVKPYGKISFIADKTHLSFYIKTGSYLKYYLKGPYGIDKLKEFSVKDNSQLIYQSKKGVIPMMTGGLLFGPAGAVAGSMVGTKSTKEVTDHKYEITFVIDDDEFVGFTGETKDKNVALRLAKHIEAMSRGTFGEAEIKESNDFVDKSSNKNDNVDDYRKAKEEMKRLGFDSFDEYLDYLEFNKKKAERNL